jgi:regulator of replication initiation timing
VSFENNPADEDIHGECRHEIHQLHQLVDDYAQRLSAKAEEYTRPAMEVIEKLKQDNERLQQRLLTAAGDDLCRLTQEEIRAYTSGAVPIPPKDEFLASCERFHAQIASESGVNHNCLTLAQLIAENERLKQERDQWRKELDNISAELANEGPHTLEHLMAVASLGKHTTVIGKARLKQLSTAEQDLAEYKRLYELRGKALQRPCISCGYEPAVIKPMEQGK